MVWIQIPHLPQCKHLQKEKKRYSSIERLDRDIQKEAKLQPPNKTISVSPILSLWNYLFHVVWITRIWSLIRLKSKLRLVGGVSCPSDIWQPGRLWVDKLCRMFLLCVVFIWWLLNSGRQRNSTQPHESQPGKIDGNCSVGSRIWSKEKEKHIHFFPLFFPPSPGNQLPEKGEWKGSQRNQWHLNTLYSALDYVQSEVNY